MAQIESFQLDHTIVHAPYVRIAGVDHHPSGAAVQKYDLRLIQPNEGAIPTAGLHTLEHFLSTFLRDEVEGIIDLSPMGCRTGFYLVLWDEHPPEEIAAGLERSLKKVLEQTTVPAATEKQCGNAADHSLAVAQEYARQVLDQGISLDPFKRNVLGEQAE